MDGDYDRDFIDPHQVPPEPIGWWGLGRRSGRWEREEDRWGTSDRTRERELERGQRDASGYGRRDTPWQRASDSRGGGSRSWHDRPRGEWAGGWRGREPDRGRWEEEWPDEGVTPADRERGTGAWGPGQAEPGLWGREPEQRRSRRQWYDRDLESAEPGGRGRYRGIEWNGWGYQVGRGRHPGERGRPGRTSSDEWGQYRSSGGGERASGAWHYGRHREHMFEATGEAARHARRHPRPARPDLREGEAWNEIGPGRWAGERRPREREGSAREWDGDFYFGPQARGGGTPPSLRRDRWTRRIGSGPYGAEYRDDYGPPAHDDERRADHGW